MHTVDELREAFYLYIKKRFAITLGGFDSRNIPFESFRGKIFYFKMLKEN